MNRIAHIGEVRVNSVFFRQFFEVGGGGESGGGLGDDALCESCCPLRDYRLGLIAQPCAEQKQGACQSYGKNRDRNEHLNQCEAVSHFGAAQSSTPHGSGMTRTK